MFRAFREKRANSLDGGRPKQSKYVLYFVGEFILVLFSIMLALQINNWSEDRKDQQLVDRIKHSLQDEFSANLERVTTAIDYHSVLIEELSNGQHVIRSVPLTQFDFPWKNLERLEKLIEQEIVRSLAVDEEEIEIYQVDSTFYLRIQDEINSFEEINDTLFFYGTSNIQLRPAFLSNYTWDIAQATNATVKMDYALVSQLAKNNASNDLYLKTVEKGLEILYSGDGEIFSVLQDMFWMEKSLQNNYHAILGLMDE